MLNYPHIDPVAFRVGPLRVHWYGIMYLVAFGAAWLLARRRAKAPGSTWGAQQVDDFIFYAMLGTILGGRIGYVLFYATPLKWWQTDWLYPIKVWDGGMSFHGGMIGTSIGIILFARRHKLNWLRIHDYLAGCVPFGLFFGRLANFVNGELWGKPSDAPWAIVFPRTVAFGVDPARHPSQLYEAGLEGIVLFAILWFAFWKTKARYEPGKLVGLFLLGYGLARFIVEFFREPDSQFSGTFFATTIHMGQVLTLPMIVGGLYLVLTAKGRRHRVEPIAGGQSVA